MSYYSHVAIIPARKNSKGFPMKNRLYFNKTAKFVKSLKWFEKIILTSDDKWFKARCKKNKFEFYQRNKNLSGPKVPIKKVLQDIIKKNTFSSKTILWLIYIPLIPKSKHNYTYAKNKIETKKVKSLCGFTNVITHPFQTWGIKNKKIFQFVKNNVFRRQDLPKAYSHNHIVCCFKINEIKNLNNELLNVNTFPLIIKEKITEID